MRIRDPGWRQFGSDGKKSDPGSGINIPDPQHWFIDLLDPDPLVRGTDPDPSIIKLK